MTQKALDWESGLLLTGYVSLGEISEPVVLASVSSSGKLK